MQEMTPYEEGLLQQMKTIRDRLDSLVVLVEETEDLDEVFRILEESLELEKKLVKLEKDFQSTDFFRNNAVDNRVYIEEGDTVEGISKGRIRRIIR